VAEFISDSEIDKHYILEVKKYNKYNSRDLGRTGVRIPCGTNRYIAIGNMEGLAG
jgi:hypothetical protein